MKLNDFDLNKLSVFAQVVRDGGITRAARKLRLTPSAVSQSVRSLEDALQVTLFDRVGRQLKLTKDGASLLSTVERYQGELSERIRGLQRGQKGIPGRVRLGVFTGFSNSLLADFLAAFHRQHSRIDVDVRFAAPSQLDRQLAAGRLDFAINLFEAEPSSRLNQTLLIRDELWLVTSVPPPARPLQLSELYRAPFVDYYRQQCLVPAWIQHHFGCRVASLPITMHVSTSELAVQLIRQGVGVGIVASSIAEPFVRCGELFVVRSGQPQQTSPVWLRERKVSCAGGATHIFASSIRYHFRGGC